MKPRISLFLLMLFMMSSTGMSNTIPGKQTQTEQITLIDGTIVTDIIDIETRGDFSVALKRDGRVFGKGKNQYGQLGRGRVSEEFFTPIETASGPLENVDSISCTETATIAYKKEGTIWNSAHEIELLALGVPENRSRTDKQNDSKTQTGPSPQNSSLRYQNTIERVLLASGDTSDTNTTLLTYSDVGIKQPQPELPMSVSITAEGPHRAPAINPRTLHLDGVGKPEFYSYWNTNGHLPLRSRSSCYW